MSSDAPRPVGRPRDPSVDEAVLTAAFTMLADSGYEGVTIEAVAAAAGVGKNTIYRRWPDKVSMVVDAIGAAVPKRHVSIDTGDIRADVTTMLLRSAESLADVDGRVVMSVASALSRHPELADAARSTLMEPRRRELQARIRRAVDAGQLPADTDVELLSAVGPALLYDHVLLTGTAPDEAYVRRIVAQFWG